MNKKYNLTLFTLVFAALCGLFTLNIFAQKTDSSKSEQPSQSQCTGEKFVMPSAARRLKTT
ncbi:MAG TPA: hypothetical protein VF721_24270 [Pyrinomonadaceae bacterium]|jgi:hypothetical protein